MRNPYEPPKTEDNKVRDRWGEVHRPDMIDWFDFFWIVLILFIIFFGPFLSKLLMDWLSDRP